MSGSVRYGGTTASHGLHCVAWGRWTGSRRSSRPTPRTPTCPSAARSRPRCARSSSSSRRRTTRSSSSTAARVRRSAIEQQRCSAVDCSIWFGLVRRRALQHGPDRLRARVAHLEGVRAVCAALAISRQLDQVVWHSAADVCTHARTHHSPTRPCQPPAHPPTHPPTHPLTPRHARTSAHARRPSAPRGRARAGTTLG